MLQRILMGVVAVFGIGGWAGALDQSSPPVVKHVPLTATSPVSGHDMYTAYCAACHGTDGKGGGPAASSLKVAPPNLTLLSKGNGGKFPSDRVSAVLNGATELPAHGSKQMPVWGQLFWTVSHGSAGEVQLRLQNLSKYIESLQEK
jgi:mono/diheme cytochrome c family protein